jgi:hypothetical protein
MAAHNGTRHVSTLPHRTAKITTGSAARPIEIRTKELGRKQVNSARPETKNMSYYNHVQLEY